MFIYLFYNPITYFFSFILDDENDDLESGPPSMLSPSSAAAAAAAAAQHQLHMMNIITGGHHQDDHSSPSSHKKMSPFSIDSLLSSVKGAAAAYKVKLEKEAEEHRRNLDEEYMNGNQIKSEERQEEDMEHNGEGENCNGRSSRPSSIAGSPECPSLSPRSPQSAVSNNNNTSHYINSMIPTSPSQNVTNSDLVNASSSPPTSNPSSPSTGDRPTQLLPQLPFSAASLLLQNHAAAVAARAAAVQAAQANVSLLKPITSSPEKNLLLQSIQQQTPREEFYPSATRTSTPPPTSNTPPMTTT